MTSKSTLTDLEKKLLLEIGPRKEYTEYDITRIALFISQNGIKELLRDKISEKNDLHFDIDFLKCYSCNSLKKYDFENLDAFLEHVKKEIIKSVDEGSWKKFDHNLPFTVSHTTSGKGVRILQKLPEITRKETQKDFLKRFKVLLKSFYRPWDEAMEKYKMFNQSIEGMDEEVQEKMRLQYINAIVEPKISKESKISVKDFLRNQK